MLDSTTNFIEHPKVVAQRIRTFADIVGRDRVIAGTDCGFSTFAGFGAVDPQIVWAKLHAMLSEGAAIASSALWGQGGMSVQARPLTRGDLDCRRFRQDPLAHRGRGAGPDRTRLPVPGRGARAVRPGLPIDGCVMAARAAGQAGSRTYADGSAPEHILNALDCGATGSGPVPHIRSAEEAKVRGSMAAHLWGGWSEATPARAAPRDIPPGPMADASRRQRIAETTVIAQIEDVEALEAHRGYRQGSPGVDALFVGRVDLTVALGAASQDDPRVVAAVDRICAAGRAAGRTHGGHVP